MKARRFFRSRFMRSAASAAMCGSDRPRRRGRFAILLALVCLVAVSPAPALCQTLADRIGGGHDDKQNPMVVESTQVIYNDDAQTVSAVGDAQIYYKGKILEADRVTYDRKTGRVQAEGSVKLTEPDGTVTHAERMDLTSDFKAGFVDSLREDSSSKTHFSAPRAEKVDEDTTVFEKGTYTACPSCKDNPDKPPLWRVRAKKIIHKNKEQMIYYEDAWLEFLGVPVAYIPYLSSPDPSATRKSGVLAPHIFNNSRTGFGVGVPYFVVLAPNMDVTLTPSYLTKEGFLGEIEFRHRTDNGYYWIRATGIHENQPNNFAAEPWGSQLPDRGALQSQGLFYLNPQWQFGWDVTRLSDKFFLFDYGVPNSAMPSFFSETASTIFLTGQGDRGYFDLRGYTFQSLTPADLNSQMTNVAPMLDYNKSFDIDPAKSWGIGGQATIDANFTNSSAQTATFQQIGSESLDREYGLYDVCRNTATPSGQPYTYTPSTCLLRGIGGLYTTATLDLSWQRKYIDPLGEVWSPFVFARAHGSYLDYNTSGTETFNGTVSGSPVTDTISNAGQAGLLGDNNSFNGQITPGVGLEWRYPLLTKTPIGSLVIEPIAQVVARPNGPNPNTLVNIDAQSLVFDDSNLFEWNKYSGYDRFETGVRANYGAQFMLDMGKNGYASAMFGQSAQIAGVNSYATADAANIGISSGLDTRDSDYVSRFSYAPSSNFTFIAKARFDQQTWAPRRIDASANAHFGPLTLGVQFADYEAQPEIGYYERREGLGLNTKYKLTTNYFVQGNIMFDLGRHYYDALLSQNAPVFSIASAGVGFGYTDDCTTFLLQYFDTMSDAYGYPATYWRNRTIMATLQLRTLGDLSVKQSLGNTLLMDGVPTYH